MDRTLRRLTSILLLALALLAWFEDSLFDEPLFGKSSFGGGRSTLETSSSKSPESVPDWAATRIRCVVPPGTIQSISALRSGPQMVAFLQKNDTFPHASCAESTFTKSVTGLQVLAVTIRSQNESFA